MPNKLVDLTGKTFGRLVVLLRAPNHATSRSSTMWLCRCDCGNEKVVMGENLKNGHTRSCGCIHMERNTVHGHVRRSGATRTYRIWANMIQRCTKESNPTWRLYGARGITVCERWLTFENFLSDMGECPANLSIDRINNDGNYEPDNCRWATQSEQCSNRRGNVVLEIDNISMTMTGWAECVGIDVTAIQYRLKCGWPAKDAVFRKSNTAKGMKRKPLFEPYSIL